MQQTSHMNRLDWAILLILSFLWGGSFFLGKIALQAISPWAIVFARLFLAAMTLNVIAFLLRKFPPLNARLWGQLFILGLINNAIPFSLIFWGQQYIASGLASIINATTPLFSTLFVHYFKAGEPLNLRRFIGVLVGFGGVSLLIGPSAFEGIGGHFAGEIAIIGAAISYALAAIYARRFRHLPSIMPAIGQINSATLIILPIWLFIEMPLTHPALPDTTILISLLVLGVFCTAFAYMLYFRLIANAGATNATLVTFLVPVSALLLGHFFLGEQLTANQYAGMALIFLGLALIDGRLFRK